MQAHTAGQGLCRFQSMLRPSLQCQCSTSSATRPSAKPCISRRSAVAVHNTNCSSSGSSSGWEPTQGSTYNVAQPSSSQQQYQQQPQPAAQPSWQQPRKGSAHRKEGNPVLRGKQWDYKYRWQACPSHCAHGDVRCYKVEALIQNVLSYPNMPPKICRRLPNIAADMDSMTALVEQMASYFGKELTLIYINNTPDILGLDFNTVLQRIKGFTQLLGVLDSDVPMMLRKYSGLVALEPQELKLRYDNLRELTQFDNQQMRAFVLKFPMAFSYQPQNVRNWIERFQQLCLTRDEWTREYQLAMTPSLMAFFLRDASDLLLRFEYLASTGERMQWSLREVMKPTERTFKAKTRNYSVWVQRIKARRAEQRAALKAARLQQQQSDAAEIKAALLADDDGQQQQQQQQQQEQHEQQQQSISGSQ